MLRTAASATWASSVSALNEDLGRGAGRPQTILGWNEVTVWDCYAHRQMPNAKKSIVQKVPAHGTRIYRLALAETKGR